MFRRRSNNCCKSTSTSASSRSENYLDLGRTKDDDKKSCLQPRWQETDQPNPLCPPRSNMVIRRDLRPVHKESKHRVQIKFIGTKKPRKTEDHKLIHVVPSKSHTSGSNDLDEKVVSDHTNSLSYTIPATSTSEDVTKTTNIKISEDVVGTTKINDSKEADQNDNSIIEKSSEQTHTEITEEFHKHDDSVDEEVENPPDLRSDDIGEGGEQEQMDNLIENFKSEALKTDDAMFEKLFERLKYELELLSCECTDSAVSLKNTSSKSEDDAKAHNIDNDDADVRNNAEEVLKLQEIDEDSRKHYYLGMQEMRGMFTELKLLLEKKLSECRDKTNNRNIDEVLKTSIDIAISTTCLGDINGKFDSLSKERRMNDETPISKFKKNSNGKLTADNTLTALVDLYDKIAAKIDEIACQCNSDGNRIFLKNSKFMSAPDSNLGPSSFHTQISKNVGNEREMEETAFLEEKLADDNKINYFNNNKATSFHAKKSEGLIPLDQFVNLANELKEAVYTSSCKCTKKRNERSHREGKNSPKESSSDGEISLNFTEEACRDSVSSSAPHPNAELPANPSSKHYTLLEKAAELPVKILDLFVKPKSPTYSSPIVDSPLDSFYSAESSNCQTTSTVIHKREEEVGANTACRCFADQVVQTFEDMKISYGVFCDEQLPTTKFPLSIPDIEIRRKTSQGGDLEKVQVRIRLKEGEMGPEPEDCVTTVMKIGESKQFAQPFADYEIKCETTQSHIDEPKVVKAGNQIKIFIPLDNNYATVM